MGRKTFPPVPRTIDMTQHKKVLKIPEIRVWCHEDGKDCYYNEFRTFRGAIKFIQRNQDIVTSPPMIAINGWEVNLFEMKKVPKKYWASTNKKLSKYRNVKKRRD